jgi:hypothetical protein
VKRVRKSTALALVLFVIAMGLWSRLNQSHVWQKLVGKLSDLHSQEPDSQLSDSALSGRRQVLGKECLQTLMSKCCVLLANKDEMPEAFFGRYRLMAIDGSVAWITPTRSSRQGMWVRIISYRFTDERLGEKGKVYRLVTTLLNPRTAPALTLVELYHERWEIELVLDEIKKKRDLPPSEPFDPDDQFLDFVELLNPLPTLKRSLVISPQVRLVTKER